MLFKGQTDVNCKQDITANERELMFQTVLVTVKGKMTIKKVVLFISSLIIF